MRTDQQFGPDKIMTLIFPLADVPLFTIIGCKLVVA